MSLIETIWLSILVTFALNLIRDAATVKSAWVRFALTLVSVTLMILAMRWQADRYVGDATDRRINEAIRAHYMIDHKP